MPLSSLEKMFSWLTAEMKFHAIADIEEYDMLVFAVKINLNFEMKCKSKF